MMRRSTRRLSSRRSTRRLATLAACTLTSPALNAGVEALCPPQGRMLSVAGGKLHVLRLNTRAKGVPMVMIHGLLGQIGNFTYALAQRLNRPLILVDRPGSGYSPARRDNSITAQARVILALLDKLNLTKVEIVGHSLGGAMAMEMLRLSPERITRLRLIAPALFAEAPPYDVVAPVLPLLKTGLSLASYFTAPAMPVLYPLHARGIFLPDVPPVGFGRYGGGWLAMRDHNLRAAFADIQALWSHFPVLEDSYAALDRPVDLLLGGRDVLIRPHQHGERLAAMHPDLVRVTTVADAGHMVLATHPDEAARFLNA